MSGWSFHRSISKEPTQFYCPTARPRWENWFGIRGYRFLFVLVSILYSYTILLIRTGNWKVIKVRLIRINELINTYVRKFWNNTRTFICFVFRGVNTSNIRLYLSVCCIIYSFNISSNFSRSTILFFSFCLISISWLGPVSRSVYPSNVKVYPIPFWVTFQKLVSKLTPFFQWVRGYVSFLKRLWPLKVTFSRFFCPEDPTNSLWNCGTHQSALTHSLSLSSVSQLSKLPLHIPRSVHLRTSSLISTKMILT